MPKTIALLAGGALLAAGTAHADRSEWPTNFTVGTASQGGTYFVYGSGWAHFIADELGVSGGGEVTGGPTQNLALVHSGDMAFGLTTMGPAS
ncbi:TAXI family TRAP transporter solute-binding subunit, partial [Guyparkeria sp. 1SP6A2]|nr:TAXI family TRAP transporter solute-binding subunit [Guyparkeria sp. 1SP6A2]